MGNGTLFEENLFPHLWVVYKTRVYLYMYLKPKTVEIKITELPKCKIVLCISGVFLTGNMQKKDRKRHFYKPENLERAVQAVKAGILNTYQAARYFNVPRGTISNKIYARKTRAK